MVVVGAGVTGLVTAHRLAEAGWEVVVVERLDTLGGLARSFHYGALSFDVGPHRFHTSDPEVSAYLGQLLGDSAVRFPRRSMVHFQDRYYDWPLRPADLVQLPPGIALAAARDLARNSLRSRTVDSFESYVLAQYGETLYAHFFRDYSTKFLGIPPRLTHADWAKTGINRAIIDESLQLHNLFQLARTTLVHRPTQSAFLYPERGMGELWSRLAGTLRGLGVRILTGHPARLEAADERIVAVTAGSERIPCTSVVWTAPITEALRQLGHPAVELSFLGLVLFNLVVRGEPARPFQWCYYGQRDVVFNRVSVPQAFSAGVGPAGWHGLCVEVTCREGDRRWTHAERLAEWVVDELVRLGALRDVELVQEVHVERVSEAYPVYHLTYPAELDAARRSLARWSNLHLAGRCGTFWYNNMDHSIENAFRLASRLIRRGQAAAQGVARGA